MGKNEKVPTELVTPKMSEHDAIAQVRELLFGGEKRSTEQRFTDTDDRIEALRADMLARFSIVESRLAETERQLDNQHNAALEELAGAITDLGARVRKLVSAPRGK